MRRPPAYEWAVLGEDGDPVPGDPDAVAMLGQALRDTADAIRRESGEITALASVESWQSKAADRFRDVAGGAADSLRKAYHRYDVASRAMGTFVREGSDADWASGLEQAQRMAAKALHDAQDADAERRTVQAQLKRLPPDSPHTDPSYVSLHKRLDAANDAIAKAKSALQAAKEVRDSVAKTAAGRIHRAITHDGMHDSDWQKFEAGVGSAASDVGHFVVDAGNTVLSDFASLGNAAVHDLSEVGEVGVGLAIAGASVDGELAGGLLSLTGAGTAPGIALMAVSAAGATAGLSLAGTGADKIVNDAKTTYRVDTTSDGSGGGGGGDWDPSAEGNYTQPSGEPDPNAKPDGPPARISNNDDAKTIRSRNRENESADILAKSGYNVEQNPDVPGDKNPDYRIEGRIFDCYSPESGAPRNIWREVQKKIDKGQTDRVVLNLSDSSVDPGKLSAQFNDWPIQGLKEVIVIDGEGNVIHFYP